METHTVIVMWLLQSQVFALILLSVTETCSSIQVLFCSCDWWCLGQQHVCGKHPRHLFEGLNVHVSQQFWSFLCFNAWTRGRVMHYVSEECTSTRQRPSVRSMQSMHTASVIKERKWLQQKGKHVWIILHILFMCVSHEPLQPIPVKMD